MHHSRDAGELTDRLTLTYEDATWRLEGTIEDGDAQRLMPQITEADPKIETLVLQSPGGSVRDALDLGRHLRAAGIATSVLSGEICYSACPYLFAGGATRTAEPSASIGVHQHYFGENTLLPAFTAVSDIQRGQGAVMRYLDEMGVDPMMMAPGLATPPDEIYLLLPEELTKFRLVTAAEDAA